MNERSDLISRLLNERDFRSSYMRGKLNVLISSQIYALRKKFFSTQKALADAADMKQSRISAMEQPGAIKFNLETLIRLASTFKVGLIVKFIPYSEVLRWDNIFVQDEFDVISLDKDVEFLGLTGKKAQQESYEQTAQGINELLSGVKRVERSAINAVSDKGFILGKIEEQGKSPSLLSVGCP